MLDYLTHGREGRHPLLLHAGGMSKHEWDPFLEAWAKHFWIVAPSALGHAASPRAASLSISAMADSVLALMDELGVERAPLVGSSMGGATALWIALTAPQRVEKLVIYRSSYRTSPQVYDAVAAMGEREAWAHWRMEPWMSEQHMPQGGPDAWMEVIRKVAHCFDPATSEHQHELGDLATIRQPTLLIQGDRDPVVPLEEAVAMYQTIPDAALWMVPNATHFMGMETWRQAAFEQEVMRFLRRGNPAS